MCTLHDFLCSKIIFIHTSTVTESHSCSGKSHQLGPRHEGQLMSDGGPFPPFRSILLVLTHDYIITCVYGPTGSDGHERIDADAALRTILMPFEAKGVLYAWGPVQPANGPPTRTVLTINTLPAVI